jgi:hypothetical protein
MIQSIDMQELAIVVVAENHRPTMLNLEFLKCSGIVDESWELARQPIFNGQASQLLFQNGVSLVAQGNQIMFVESLAMKSPEDIKVGQVGRKYLQALPNANYQAAGVNFRGVVPFNQSQDAARNYLMSTLLAAGPWQHYGEEAAHASINFVYALAERRLYLSVNEAAIQLPEGETSPILLFSGNFEHSIEGDFTKLLSLMDNWTVDLAAYQDLVNTRFLNTSLTGINMSHPELIPVGV